MGNNGLISGAFSSDTTLSTPVAINKGGTGQTTAQAALDALAAASGSLVQGDIFIVDASGNVVRLARGTDNQTMVMNGNNPNWETVAAGGGMWTDIGSDVQTTHQSALTLSGFTAHDVLCIISHHSGDATGDAETLLRLNNISTSTYDSRRVANVSLETDLAQTGIMLDNPSTDHTYKTCCYIFKANSNLDYTGTTVMWTGVTTDSTASQTSSTFIGGGNTDASTDVTRVDLVMDTGNILGEMQVMGFDY